MSDDVRSLLERLERLLENVHQYVGARYVPNFIDEPWSDTRGYEALDVVDNGSGTSYIAKKPVPVGTPLSNRTYWFVYGATSGAIINLQNQIDTIVSGMQTLTVYNGNTRKVICIGDSYLGGSGTTYAETESWGAFIRMILDNGDNTIIKGWGGSGFIGQPDTSEHTYKKQLEEVVSTMDADERAEVTDILVQGGLNDKYGLNHGTYTESDILTAIQQFTAYAHTQFPNAMVRIGVVGWARDGLSDKPNFYKVLNLFRNNSSIDCNNRLQFMSGLEYIMPSMADSEYYDSTHPGTTASLRIAQAMVNCMMGGNGDFTKTVIDANATITTPTGVTATSIDFHYTINNAVASIRSAAFWVNFDTPQAFSFGNYVEIGRITGGEPIRCSEPIYIPCFAWWIDDNNIQHTTAAMVKFEDRKIMLMLHIEATTVNVAQINVRIGSYSDSILVLC